jgi:hypothetical protein
MLKVLELAMRAARLAPSERRQAKRQDKNRERSASAFPENDKLVAVVESRFFRSEGIGLGHR